jgi:hypothetical protein
MKQAVLALTLAFATTSAFAEDKLDFKPSDTVKSVLERLTGQRIELRMKSGEKLAGKVEKLGDKTLHLSAIAGQDFFDAVVVLDEVSAVLVRTK